MTRGQLAMAVMADEKWIENTARLLNKRLRYTVEESVWLGLVRMLNHELGLPLTKAAAIADEALRVIDEPGDVTVGRSVESSAAVSLDMPRFRSSHLASLSAALTLGGSRRRGRRPAKPSGRKAAVLERAAKYGVDIDLLREGLKLSVAERLQRAGENADFVADMRKRK
jgi:hypothetical protein